MGKALAPRVKRETIVKMREGSALPASVVSACVGLAQNDAAQTNHKKAIGSIAKLQGVFARVAAGS